MCDGYARQMCMTEERAAGSAESRCASTGSHELYTCVYKVAKVMTRMIGVPLRVLRRW